MKKQTESGTRTRRIKALCALLLVLVWPAVAPAQFAFTTNNGAITITGYTGSGGTVTIPDSTNGFPVKVIGDKAFYNSHTIVNVVIPNSVTSVGNYVFFYCTALTNVTIGNSVTNIGHDTFESSQLLTSVTIPDSVTSMGTNVFAYCGRLASATIGNGVTDISGYAFYNCISLT